MARRQVFSVRLYESGFQTIDPMGPNIPVAETRTFSVNASRGAAETLVRTYGRERGKRYTRIPHTRKVTETRTNYHVREDWISTDGHKILTWVEGLL